MIATGWQRFPLAWRLEASANRRPRREPGVPGGNVSPPFGLSAGETGHIHRSPPTARPVHAGPITNWKAAGETQWQSNNLSYREGRLFKSTRQPTGEELSGRAAVSKTATARVRSLPPLPSFWTFTMADGE